jgi:hypothetical protein
MTALDRTIEKTGADDLEQTLRRQIDSRTWGGVSQLQIRVQPGCAFVTGRTSSYYLKQLALDAVKDVVRPLPSVRVTVDIQVEFGTVAR